MRAFGSLVDSLTSLVVDSMMILGAFGAQIDVLLSYLYYFSKTEAPSNSSVMVLVVVALVLSCVFSWCVGAGVVVMRVRLNSVLLLSSPAQPVHVEAI